MEIRKENSNGNFIQVYEGNNTNYLIKNLDIDMNYEISICSFYEDIIGSWSKIEKVKINEIGIDSLILKEEEKKNEYLQKIFEWSDIKEWNYYIGA